MPTPRQSNVLYGLSSLSVSARSCCPARNSSWLLKFFLELQLPAYEFEEDLEKDLYLSRELSLAAISGHVNTGPDICAPGIGHRFEPQKLSHWQRQEFLTAMVRIRTYAPVSTRSGQISSQWQGRKVLKDNGLDTYIQTSKSTIRSRALSSTTTSFFWQQWPRYSHFGDVSFLGDRAQLSLVLLGLLRLCRRR